MAVDGFDPSLLKTGLTDDVMEQFLAAAARIEDAQFGLDELAIKRLGPLARADAGDWSAAAGGLEVEQIIALVRLFTLAEERLTGWESAARSPVIPLVRELKVRDAFPAELTGWIKANTSNRFLPHGSLMDRL